MSFLFFKNCCCCYCEWCHKRYGQWQKSYKIRISFSAVLFSFIQFFFDMNWIIVFFHFLDTGDDFKYQKNKTKKNWIELKKCGCWTHTLRTMRNDCKWWWSTTINPHHANRQNEMKIKIEWNRFYREIKVLLYEWWWSSITYYMPTTTKQPSSLQNGSFCLV